MHKVLLKKTAQKQLDALPTKVQHNIVQALDELATLGIHARHTKKLNPPIGGYRTRVGAYRILFDKNESIIIVHAITKRADAY